MENLETRSIFWIMNVLADRVYWRGKRGKTETDEGLATREDPTVQQAIKTNE